MKVRAFFMDTMNRVDFHRLARTFTDGHIKRVLSADPRLCEDKVLSVELNNQQECPCDECGRFFMMGKV
jgi:hypothetical protein